MNLRKEKMLVGFIAFSVMALTIVGTLGLVVHSNQPGKDLWFFAALMLALFGGILATLINPPGALAACAGGLLATVLAHR